MGGHERGVGGTGEIPASRDRSIVHHLVAIEGFQDEARQRFRRVIDDNRLTGTEMRECRELLLEMQKVFSWFNSRVAYHRIAMMRLIPESEAKRKAIAARQEQNRSLRHVHWSRRRPPHDRAERRDSAEKGLKPE
ncbi:MAG: hypothetical protein QMD46_08960 [Methanomicrobiales archaeon]|nr:hypothetical protein [Methanomicrobiales archaeon]